MSINYYLWNIQYKIRSFSPAIYFLLFVPSQDYLDRRKYRRVQFTSDPAGLHQSRAQRLLPTPTKQNPRSGPRSGLVRGEQEDRDHRAKLSVPWYRVRDIGSCLKQCLCKEVCFVRRGWTTYTDWFHMPARWELKFWPFNNRIPSIYLSSYYLCLFTLYIKIL